MRNPAKKQTKIAIEPWKYLSTSTTATTTSASCSQDTLPALLPQQQPPVRYSAFLLSSKYLKCVYQNALRLLHKTILAALRLQSERDVSLQQIRL
jgi:hypothetical protein